MLSPTVTVLYQHTQGGRNSLAVAFDLLRKLKSKDLKVVVPHMPELGDEVIRLCATRLASSIQKFPFAAGFNVTVETQLEARDRFLADPNSSVLVSSTPMEGVDHFNVLISFDEESLDGRGAGPLIFPFGNGESGAHAAKFALPLAAAMGLSVEFYHTTWANPARKEVSASEHMHAGAIELRRQLEERATALGIAFNTTIETADDVAEGLIRFSLRKGACLVAMARGRNTRVGSYVTQLLSQSPIPLLICGRPEGGER
jgi:Universal stress protein family.